MNAFQRVTICNGLDCGYVVEWIYDYSPFVPVKEINFHFEYFCVASKRKNFHSVYFLVVVVYEMVFWLNVKVSPYMGISLFDVKVDVICDWCKICTLKCN